MVVQSFLNFCGVDDVSRLTVGQEAAWPMYCICRAAVQLHKCREGWMEDAVSFEREKIELVDCVGASV